MNLEREFLRKSAGLPCKFDNKKLNEEEKFSKIKTLDVEAELLRIFSNTLRDIKRLKEMMNSRYQEYGSLYGYNPMRILKDEKGQIDKEKLLKVAMEKLDLIEEALIECFDAKKSDKDEDDEYEDEDEDEYEDDEEEDEEEEEDE